MLIPPFRTQWIAVAFGFSLAASNAWAYPTAGDPNNASQLQAAIMMAYNSGATGVTINPGKYTLTSGNVTLSGLTRSFVITAYGVTLADPQNGIEIDNCTNLSLLGLTIGSTYAYGNQGRITAFGVDSNNGQAYCELQCDAGYYTTGWGYNTVMLGNSNQPRPGCYDLTNPTTQNNLGNGKIRQYFQQNNWSGWTLQVGDYLTSFGDGLGGSLPNAYGGPPMAVNHCQNCLFQEITIQSSPGWTGILEQNCASNHYYNDKITYGPPPRGATAVPLRSVTSGFQGVDDYAGPIVQNCTFEGVGDDGLDLRGEYGVVESVNGNTVCVDHNQGYLWSTQSGASPGNRIRLSDDHGGLQDTTVNNIAIGGATGPNNAIYDVLTMNDAVTIHLNAGYQARASNPGSNCPGYQILSTTVRNGRSRGVVARGDNGLIDGCTFTNLARQAVLIGEEDKYDYDEGDYSDNVTVQNNVITNVGWVSGQVVYVGGAGYGNGLGSLGNKNIAIRNNTFIGTWGENILAYDVDGLQVSWNTFANPYLPGYLSFYTHSGPLIELDNANNVTFTSNLVTAVGPNMTSLVYQGSGVTNVNHNDSYGISEGMLSSGVYAMSPLSAPGLSLNATGTYNGTPLQQVTSNGSADQQWVVTQRNGANTTVGHLGTNQIIDDPGVSNQPHNLIATYTYNPSATWQLWQFQNDSSVAGVSNIVNYYDGLVLDVPGAYTNSGQQIQQYYDDNTNACRWQLTLVAPTPGPNLLTNGSFEWGLSYWTATGSFYNEGRWYAQNGNSVATAYASGPYVATLSQTVTGLANGYYTATAWVESSGSLASAYLYAANYGGNQLNSPTIPQTAEDFVSWQKVTITDIPVTNGQCTVGFYVQDTAGNHWVHADAVQFFRQ